MAEPLLATEAPTKTEGQAKGADDLESTATTEQPQQEPTEESAETTEKVEEPGAPEAYEFANPDGIGDDVKVDARIHDAYAEAARELNLPQDKAQKMFGTTLSAIHKVANEEQQRITDEWVKAAKADTEFGGDKLDENLGIAKKAVNEFGSDGLRELLGNPHGIGNHPEVIRFLVKVGRAISEDRFVGREGAAVDPDDEAAIAAKFYPNTKQS